MLFFSKEFLFLFLPILSILSFVAIKLFKDYNIYQVILIIASIFFYGYWSIKFLLLFLAIILFNYICASYTKNTKNLNNFYIIIFAISINLFILIYFKYYNFLIENINSVFNLKYNFKNIILPLGISFIIFQQISFLWTNLYYKKKLGLLDFLLFSLFFPQIIAGPILIIQDVVNQFKNKFPHFKINNIWSGILLFFIGIIKKVFISDNIDVWVSGPFDISQENIFFSIDYFIALLSYGLQLYFDFSAYSDMAVGLGMMFGIILPINFNSPYKAKSISEFWVTWHMTLNRFLETLIYFPMALKLKRSNISNNFIQNFKIIFFSTILTFFISGFWHGAGWNFIIWGLYHGLLVTIHRTYIYLLSENKINPLFSENRLSTIIKIFITNTFVFLSWILFRSTDLGSSLIYLENLFNVFDGSWHLIFQKEYLYKFFILSLLFSVCLFFPNSNQIIRILDEISKKKPKNIFLKLINFLQNIYADIVLLIVFILYYIRYNTENTPFIYYQF